MLCFIIEKDIEEKEPLSDEIEAIKSKEDLVGLEEIKQKLLQSK